MIKAVIDTNVLVSALRSHSGAAFRVVELWGARKYRPVISAPLVFEYESVLLRQAAAFGLTARDIGDVLDYLCAVSHHQTIYYLWRPMLRDPGDDLVLEVAVAAESKYIVTHNLKDFAESRRFGIRAVTPGAFLKLIGEIHEHD